ncbi:translation initiation factor IF-2 [Candidatus Hydrogenosomobacter endosymbioticus]|uniref:Translation initiation factor IF-2 n=1 Tax=Candidatus Hydrogenosomobacter endosymbioticus TaxID=2558174 RepID=A0ABM7V8Z4_9PROT|nr:translation initiation factor IF-2 [Candidatus Hydrogenosomobacter endosymbioticus]BDB96272.1 translation initiation factor IF-2 [Candidatus Hydrogenosomobacter endosymbioticus]
MVDKVIDKEEKKKRKPLTLHGAVDSSFMSGEPGYIRQSFTHGKSKSVEIEVKRRRRSSSGGKSEPYEGSDDKLTDKEQQARMQALRNSFIQAEEEEMRKAAEEAAALAEADEKRRIDEAGSAKFLDDKSSSFIEDIGVRASDEIFESVDQIGDASAAAATDFSGLDFKTGPDALEVRKDSRVRVKPNVGKKGSRYGGDGKYGDVGKDGLLDQQVPSKKAKGIGFPQDSRDSRDKSGGKSSQRKRGGGDAVGISEDDDFRGRGPIVGLKKLRKASNSKKRKLVTPKRVDIFPQQSVDAIANRMSVKLNAVVRMLEKIGVKEARLIDADVAELLVAEFGHIPVRGKNKTVEEKILEQRAVGSSVRKIPVVAIMGHVDHGKTTLLDALRNTDVAGGEHGGITQHIGAYQVVLKSGEKITFLDTPGHEAFSQIRARGANVTDIVVIVVAADDGVKAQTEEAIRHAQNAGVPMIIAINKIDKYNANADFVRERLLSYGIIVEKLGGDVLDVEVSAMKGIGLDKLEDSILLLSQMLDLKADDGGDAVGAVVETRVKKGFGPVATVLVESGTLKKGDVIVAGEEHGKVRALIDDRGKQVGLAGPSVPVEVAGLGGLPQSGDKFIVVRDESVAEELVNFRKSKRAIANMSVHGVEIGDDIFQKFSEQRGKSELGVVVKADVQGSMEGILSELEKIKHEEVGVKVLSASVGDIAESDVAMASVSGGVIIGFNVKASSAAISAAEKDGVKILTYDIIYRAIEDIKAMLSKMLKPIYEEEILGTSEVIQIFNLSRVGRVIGNLVRKGIMRRGAKIRILRNGVVIHSDSIKSLKRAKDDIKEAKEGYECGIFLENGFDQAQLKDTIECFIEKEIPRSIE